MPVSHRLKAIFIHIPKCAGTSVVNILSNYDDALEFVGPASVSQRVELNTYHLNHVTAKHLKSVIPPDVWESYYKFTFVRDPWSRLVSIYYYRLGQLERPGNLLKTSTLLRSSKLSEIIKNPLWVSKYLISDFIVKRRNKKLYHNESTRISFTEWLQNGLTRVKSMTQNNCTNFITDEGGHNLVDFVGSHENMESDFSEICQRLGIEAELPHLNSTNHRNYRSYYTPELRNLVAEKFAQDIERFHFRF